ncbi:halocin C8-like domain-containing protein [Natronolimnohabitans sp. A-GB9]|uniref:halocin C8-like domain-containing protein n=1 Tax=Natronolimnohabitans sp. A-GB9 TaxID=3069757 RepID=UPI0027B6C458|nr:halocin C8-like domain-containing protein [Natronolimnohabitans sp. A-GB9]MDQ2050762.1 halocin C8-like domain-containing protein [Natronolimnohabitans sp. A-GB9]
MEGKDGFSRRNCLRSIGVAGAAGIGAAGLSSSVVANESEVDIVELGGPEKNKAVARAKRSDEYKTLKKALQEDGKEISKEERAAFSLTPADGESFTAVMFSYDQDNTDQSVEIGISLSSSCPIPSKATVIEHDDTSGFPLRSDELVVGIPDDTEKQTVDAEDNAFSQSTEKLTVRDETVTKRSTELQQKDTIGIQSEDFDPNECELDPMPCWACKDLVSAANVVGCGTYSWLICAAAAIPTGGMGGLACGLAVAVVCWIILEKGVTAPERVCSMEPACSC